MSNSETAGGTREVHRAVLAIRTSGPQHCQNQPIQRSSQVTAAAPQPSSCKYQSTGVQTLPPPNGDTFKLVYGRDPSHNDLVRNTGLAAIGRFTSDPRSNPYEVFHSASFPAPAAKEAKTYADAGFQAAGCDTTRLALARAKVKASMTTKKYREVALQAGYAISAESKDEMIVHSEQYATIVRLDAKGNLLEGDVNKLRLPNILGTRLQPQTLTLQKTPVSLAARTSNSVEYDNHVTLPGSSPYSSPTHSCAPTSEANPIEQRTQIPALASSSRGHNYHLMPVFDEEYGNVGSYSSKFVIVGAGSCLPPKAPKASQSCLQKRKFDGPKHIDASSKKPKLSSSSTPRAPSKPAAPSSERSKVSSLATPERSPPPMAPSSKLSTQPPLRARDMPRKPPPSEPKSTPLMPRFVRPRPGDAGQEHILTVRRSGSTDTWKVNKNVLKKREHSDKDHVENSYNKPTESDGNTAFPTIPVQASDISEPHLLEAVHGRKKPRLSQDLVREDPADMQNTPPSSKSSSRSHQPKSVRIGKESKSRDSRPSRKPLTPYVPPGMRAKILQTRPDNDARRDSSKR